MSQKPFLCVLVAIPVLGLIPLQRSTSRDQPGPSDSRYVTIDYDRDGRIDYFVIEPGGRGRLLVRADDGTFLDRTEAVGLEAMGPVGRAYWKDLTGDRWPDLVVVSPDGRVRLFVGDGTTFEDQSPALAAASGTVVNAIAFDDYDLDGWYDLELWTADGGTLLVLNRGGLVFELGQSAWLGGRVRPVDLAPLPDAAPGQTPLVVSGGPGTSALGPGVCADQLINQETGGCLEASTIPALGRLYPLGPDLFVDASTGHVGINTTTPDPTPGVALDINGGARVSGDLRVSGPGNRIYFQDGSWQDTAMAVGPAGAPGQQGPEGPPGTTLPAGTILMWGGSAAPDGFLLCDGSPFDPGMYPGLAAAIGTTFGSGVSFQLPDMRQRFPLGRASAGTGAVLGQVGGAIDHTHTSAAHVHNLSSHTHTDPSHSHGMAHAHSVPAHYHSAQGSGADINITSDNSEQHVHDIGGKANSTGTGNSNRFVIADGSGASTEINAGSGAPPGAAGEHIHDHASFLGRLGNVSSGINGDAAFSSGGSSAANTGAASGGQTGGPSNNSTGSTTPGLSGVANPPFLVINYIIKS